MNNKISEKDKKAWDEFLSNNQKLPDKDNIQNKTEKIEQQILKNNLKKTEVIELKKGYKVIEQKARYELGLIKKGEIFILRNEWQD